VGKCLNYIAMLMGAMGIVADVAARPENISSLAPLIAIHINDADCCSDRYCIGLGCAVTAPSPATARGEQCHNKQYGNTNQHSFASHDSFSLCRK
jgi:hypothetical protein